MSANPISDAGIPDQTPEEISRKLTVLIDLAESLGIAIRPAPPNADPDESEPHSAGALVRLKGREIIFLDTAASLADQLTVVGSALVNRSELQDRFLPPEIRELIDSFADQS